MKFANSLKVLLVVICLMPVSGAAEETKAGGNLLGQMPLAFTQNDGQWPDSILFRANAGGATMWFTPSGAYYQFIRYVPNSDGSVLAPGATPDRLHCLGREPEQDNIETMMIKAAFVGANPNPIASGSKLMEYKCNYFLGNNPAGWRTDVPNYEAILLKEVYPGIDLTYYGDGRQMEYDFVVNPGADYSQIRIQYEGAKSLVVNDNGDLVIETAWGMVIEKAPLVYQGDGANRTAIAAAFHVEDDCSFVFTLGQEYDPALAVVIDPSLKFSTYLNGNVGEFGNGIAVDGLGAAYVAGQTSSANFPTVNSYQGSFGGTADAFVTKFSPSGNSLIYSTYLGGNAEDDGWGIAVDKTGAAYITGITFSTDFPTFVPYQSTYQGDGIAFATKLSPTGNSLIYSTYLGGSGSDNGIGIAVDTSGAAYISGITTSADFPMSNPYDGSYNGGYSDVFVTALSPTGYSLIYSTYLGGNDQDLSYGIALDASGAAYITGFTFSTDYPMLNPYQGTLRGPEDAFVTKLSPTGSNLIYSTYLGGSSSEGGDVGRGIALDASGSAYITGITISTDFPTFDPYRATLKGYQDAFVTKFSPSGTSLIYSTYLDESTSGKGGIAVDASGSAYITGSTFSTEFPILDPYQSTNHGEGDAFVTKFSPAGNSLIYSTYVGGSSTEVGEGIAVDGSGAAYITGYTGSADFPTLNPYQGAFQGTSWNAFIAKFLPPFVCGDANGNGTVNALDITFLINYLYKHGSAPNPLESADVNHTGTINALDITYLINYLYKHGPAPACP